MTESFPTNEMALWVSETHPSQTRLSFKVKETLFHGQSPFQTVDIVDTVAYGRLLLLDGMVMTTEKDEFIYHEMISHMPLLAHPNPKRVLVIGGGDGGTIREVLKHPSVEEVVLCEIDGMVVDACTQYLPSIACELDNPKVNLIIGDGVAYMKTQARNFDIIIIDSTDPIGPGEGLFTKDFYTDTFKALNDDGIMVAQTENPMLCPNIITTIYPMYQSLFPIVRSYYGVIPTYPGALWTWCFCAKQYQPELPVNSIERAKAIQASCQYYNVMLHNAALTLPTYVQRLVEQPAPVGV